MMRSVTDTKAVGSRFNLSACFRNSPRGSVSDNEWQGGGPAPVDTDHGLREDGHIDLDGNLLHTDPAFRWDDRNREGHRLAIELGTLSVLYSKIIKEPTTLGTFR